ncbi:hypothetical protein EV426DRAFT_718953 [Tirmania nivea]|nr:hypothetical protein EV426DRAFT_718953 [Tirmania nivea]
MSNSNAKQNPDRGTSSAPDPSLRPTTEANPGSATAYKAHKQREEASAAKAERNPDRRLRAPYGRPISAPTHEHNRPPRSRAQVIHDEARHDDNHMVSVRGKGTETTTERASDSGLEHRDAVYSGGYPNVGRDLRGEEHSNYTLENTYENINNEQPKGSYDDHGPKQPSVAALSEQARSRRHGGSFLDGIRSLVGPSTTNEDLASLRNQYKVAQRHIEELDEERSLARKELDTLLDEVKRVTHERDNILSHFRAEQGKDAQRINELESQVRKEQNEKLNHQRRVDIIAAQLDNKELFLGLQMSDSSILGMWYSLWPQVKSWSASFSSEEPIDKKVLKRREDWFRILTRIAPGDPELGRLDKRKTRREFVQAIVGYTLAEVIFLRLPNDGSSSAKGETQYAPVQTTEHCVAINNLERALCQAQSTISPRELNDWRAFTVSLFSRIESNLQDRTYAVATQYASNLMRMISGWAKPTASQEALERGLIVVLQKALELATEIRKQRACWSVELPSCGSTEFNREVMDDLDDGDEDQAGEDPMETHRLVGLYVFPGLYKQGNADGEHYDLKICLVKGKVKCKQG